jgi:formiminotetrahydrofolate cyclodeaminase
MPDPVQHVSVGVREFVAAVGAHAPTPGGGAASALAASLAAALTEMAGRYTVGLGRGPEPASLTDLIRRAEGIRERALCLADEDARAYDRYAAALRIHSATAPDRRRRALSDAADAAAEVPAELGRLAVEIAELGEQLIEWGNPHLRSDACAAVLLSAAVASSAAVLVSENLRARRADARIRGRIDDARRCAQVAVAAATRVVEVLDLALEGNTT